MNLDKTICVACGQARTLIQHSDDCISCSECETTYDCIDGIPCLVRYQKDEALSLVEVLSNLDIDRVPPTSKMYDHWIKLLSEYHSIDEHERKNYLSNFAESYHKTLPHRHRQYAALQNAIEGIPLSGAHILDVGAGEGFDTAILLNMGAKVSAVEFSPISAIKGAAATPDAGWYCGSVHAIPFEDNSFDHVFCMAAVHHFLNVPAAIGEMLRVLKPGGYLFTVSDSYRKSVDDESKVVAQFNDNPAVLRGVNENVPRFCDFFAAFHDRQDCVDVSIFTRIVYGFLRDEKRINIDETTEWKYPDAYEALGDTAGGMTLRIKKLQDTGHKVSCLKYEAIKPAQLMDIKTPKVEAMSILSQSIPIEYTNQVFPGNVGNTKFNLLNGWRAREEGESGRTAYSRARWYMYRNVDQHTLRLSVSLPGENKTEEIDAQIFIMGKKYASIALVHDQETEADIDIKDLPLNTIFPVEIILDAKSENFTDLLFRVHRLGFKLTKSSSVSQKPNIQKLNANSYKPSYVWPNPSFPFRIYFESPALRIFIIENIQHNWNWLKEYSCKFLETDYFFVIGGWYQSPFFAQEAETIFDILKIDRSKFYFFFNSSIEETNFKVKGFEGGVINQNAWLDENRVMKIIRGATKRYNAIYVARYSAFKRHHLAKYVSQLALVAGNNHNNPIANDVPQALYANERVLTSDEVCLKINESRCGLILSETEGACFASSEYLLCGIPVVSTKSFGGREFWYNEYNSVICNDDPVSVARGVQYFIDNPRDPEIIRQQHIELAQTQRQKFIILLDKLFKEHDIPLDPAQYFKDNFFHKMRTSFKPDFDAIFR